MTVVTGPTQINPSHHVKLTDGTSTVGLVLVDGYGNPDARGFQSNPLGQPIKITQGESRYSDTLPPWEKVEMNDFSGGFGSREFDRDKSRYYWGLRAYTHNGSLSIGPQPVWTNGIYRNWTHKFIAYKWHDLTATNPYLAVKFTTTATTAITMVHFVAKLYYGKSITVSIYTDVGGNPGVLVGSAGTTGTTQSETQEYVVTVASGALSNTTDYWLVFHSSLSGTETNSILCALNDDAPVAKYGTSVPAWTRTETLISYYAPFFVIGQRYGDNKHHFFEYKGALYAALQFDAGTTSYLFLGGDQGVVKAGGSATSVTSDSGVATWAADEAIGCVFIIVAGTGSTQPRNFRVIEDNGATSSTETNFVFTSDPWDVAPDATSEYVIVASNKWTLITPDITGSNPWANLPVTDVLSVNNAVYFAHGDANDTTRMRAYNSAQVWTYEWTVEADNSEATYLMQCSDPNGSWIWKAKGGPIAKVAKAPSVDCSGTAAAADLVWETELGVDNLGSRITNMQVYGEDYGQLFILKEDGLYRMYLASDDTDYVGEVSISAFPATKDWRNGRAACVHDTYLYFSWHDTVMRYYRSYLDNIGPNSQDVIMPKDYRGVISGLLSYPGMLVCSIDAGDSGYSTVNAYNGTGWCNLFTAPTKGMRIQNIYIQSIPIPGGNVGRLWISCADTSLWIPISTNPLEEPVSTYNSYKHAWNAKIELGLVNFGRFTVSKYWESMKFFYFEGDYPYTITTGLGSRTITLEDETISSGDPPYYFSEETSFGSGKIQIDHTANWIIPEITISNTASSVKYVVRAITIEALSVEDIKRTNTLTVRIADKDKDLIGDFDDYLTADAKLAQLTTWEQTPTALTMTSAVGLMDTKTVFIVRGGIRLISISRDDLETKYILQMQVYET